MRLIPPAWVAIGVAVQYAADRWAPGARLVAPPLNWLGLALVAAGVALIAWCIVLFKRARTGLTPFSDTTALVATGPYRFSRNPIYLGMTVTLLGSAITFGTLAPFLVVPAFVWIITVLFVVPEEAHMEEALGDTYRDFKSRVRRWV